MGVGESALLLLLLLLSVGTGIALEQRQPPPQPHVIYILADDMGWNDAGFTGNSDLQTPNIDALAYHGRTLARYYTPPICTPSRTALLTGKYPYRTGMQGYPLSPSEPRGLPLDQKLMPQYFKELGYQTHLVGKWHLGYHEWKYTPTQRNNAFDSHFGYMNGFIGYFDHIMTVRNMSGLDLWRDAEPQYDLRGRYLTDLLTEEAVRLISEAARPAAEPLFLLLSHQAPHAGNPGPDDLEYHEKDIQRFHYISNERRRKYAAMVWALDRSVGVVVDALRAHGMLDNTIVVFASDNGAITSQQYSNEGSNFPQRGIKFSFFEGGVHNLAAVWSLQLQQHGKGVSQQLFHAVDWLPTLYAAAGGDPRQLSGIDGRNQWPSLLDPATEDEPRSELLVNVDEVRGQYALVWHNHKYVLGSYNPAYDTWQGDYSNPSYSYSAKEVAGSVVGRVFASLEGPVLSEEHMLQRRDSLRLSCVEPQPSDATCDPAVAPCLFDLSSDPCERINLAQVNATLLQIFQLKLDTYMTFLKPSLGVPNEDFYANPAHYNSTWFPWHSGVPGLAITPLPSTTTPRPEETTPQARHVSVTSHGPLATRATSEAGSPLPLGVALLLLATLLHYPTVLILLIKL